MDSNNNDNTTATTFTSKPGDIRLGDLLYNKEEESLIYGDIVLILYPCDLGVIRNGGRYGAKFGPSTVLEHMRRMGCVQNPEYNINLTNLKLSYYTIPLDDLNLIEEDNKEDNKEDSDDIDILEIIHERLTQAVKIVLDNHSVPIVIGGGNDQSIANWRALQRYIITTTKNDDDMTTTIGVINIDAHLDVRPLIDKKGKYKLSHSGSPFRQILEESKSTTKLITTKLYEFGVQGSQCSQEHANYVTDNHNGTIFWFKDIKDNVPSKFQMILNHNSMSPQDNTTTSWFISFDIDSIQSSDCPGVSCPSTIGLTAQDALNIMYIAGITSQVQLIDISELNPLVENYRSPRLVVQMIYYFLLGYVQRNNNNNNNKSLVANSSSTIPKSISLPVKKQYRLRIHNINQIICVEDKWKQGYRVGHDMKELNVIKDGTILVDLNGRISFVGSTNDAPNITKDQIEVDINGYGKSVIPGLCDSHTHAVWDGDRVHEFVMKLAGATYMDIHNMGGGINFTVQHTQNATATKLYDSLKYRLQQMSQTGTTLIEIKSGYGLNTETELKMLHVIDQAQQNLSFIDIVGNFCGAHSIPQNQTEEQAVDTIINEMIPTIAVEQSKGHLSCVKLIDVFAEKGVFSTEVAEKILLEGNKIGLLGNFHGDELSYQACGELAGKLKCCRAVSHLEHISDEGIVAMKESNTVAVLLPTTAFMLRITPPPARKLIDSGVPVALGSDFNPNAHCSSMAYVMNLACVTMKMSVEEALVASTLNAAYSMDMHNTHGSLEVGKHADMLLINAPRWEHIIYQFGTVPPLSAVIKDGVPTFLQEDK